MQLTCSSRTPYLQEGLCSGRSEAVAGIDRFLVFTRVKSPPHGVIIPPCLELRPDLLMSSASALRGAAGLSQQEGT